MEDGSVSSVTLKSLSSTIIPEERQNKNMATTLEVKSKNHYYKLQMTE